MNSRLKFRIVFACLSLVLGLQLGCESTNIVGTDPNVPQGPIYIAEVRPGDKVLINFADNPGIQPLWEQTVSSDGMLFLPMNQKLKAEGLQEGQLEQAIHDLYVPKLLTRLTVNVRLEQRSFFVGGEVENPGQRELTGSMTAMKAIMSAGDFTDFANKSRIEVTRAGGEKIEVDGKKAQRNPSRYDVPIYAGDRVYVHRRIF